MTEGTGFDKRSAFDGSVGSADQFGHVENTVGHTGGTEFFSLTEETSRIEHEFESSEDPSELERMAWRLREILDRLMMSPERTSAANDQEIGALRFRIEDLSLRIHQRSETLRTSTPIATIYLDSADGAEDVEQAVRGLIRSAGGTVAWEEGPVLSSWFKRMGATFRRAAESDIGKEVQAAGVQAATARVVHAPNAQNTATMLQNLGPVITSIANYRDVVIRVEALLIVKLDGALVVHQLTPAQQLALDRNPALARLPHDILPALGLSEREPAFETASERPAVQ